MQANITGAQIASVGVGATPQGGPPRELRRHFGANSVPIAPGPLELDLQPVTVRHSLVQQQTRGSVVIGNYDVDIAIVVDVAESRAAAGVGESESPAGFRARVAKLRAFVVEQQIFF